MSAINVLVAVSILMDVIVTASEGLATFQKIVGQAQREGRDLTDEEVATFRDSYKKAFDRLQATD